MEGRAKQSSRAIVVVLHTILDNQSSVIELGAIADEFLHMNSFNLEKEYYAYTVMIMIKIVAS